MFIFVIENRFFTLAIFVFQLYIMYRTPNTGLQRQTGSRDLTGLSPRQVELMNAIQHESTTSAYDYVSTLSNGEVNFTNKLGETPVTAVLSKLVEYEYLLEKLIEKGGEFAVPPRKPYMKEAGWPYYLRASMAAKRPAVRPPQPSQYAEPAVVPPPQPSRFATAANQFASNLAAHPAVATAKTTATNFLTGLLKPKAGGRRRRKTRRVHRK